MMENYTKQIAVGINFPNITVYKILKNGIIDRYEALANTGYVMYDESEYFAPASITFHGEEKQEIYYCTRVAFPKSYDFAKFTYKAVLKALINT